METIEITEYDGGKQRPTGTLFTVQGTEEEKEQQAHGICDNYAEIHGLPREEVDFRFV